jgi:chromosome segregation ATPase
VQLQETKAQASDEVSKLLQEVQDTRVQLQETKAQASDEVSKLLQEVQDTRVQLQETKAQASDEVSKLLQEVQDTRVQLQEAKAQAIAVQSLELYLQEFQRHHQPHQLRHLLWKELGFVGIVVYFISLITRRK